MRSVSIARLASLVLLFMPSLASAAEDYAAGASGSDDFARETAIFAPSASAVSFCVTGPQLIQACADGKSLVSIHEAVVHDGSVVCVKRKFMCIDQAIMTPPVSIRTGY